MQLGTPLFLCVYFEEMHFGLENPHKGAHIEVQFEVSSRNQEKGDGKAEA